MKHIRNSYDLREQSCADCLNLKVMILFCHYDKIFAGPNKPSLYARWLYWLIDNHKVRYLHLVTSDSKAPEVFIANNLSCSNFAWQLRQQIDVTT